MDVSQSCIHIDIQTQYVPERSKPYQHHFVFLFLVTIRNQTNKTIHITEQQWLVTDGNNKPTLIKKRETKDNPLFVESKDKYSHATHIILSTPVGCIQGHYQIKNKDGSHHFTVNVAPFSLAAPNCLN